MHKTHPWLGRRQGTIGLVVSDEMVKDAMLARRTSHEIRRISLASSGLVTLLEDGLVKAASGLTSFQEVLHNLPHGSQHPDHDASCDGS